MGNYYGTVRCRKCQARGHNSRTCPAYTVRLQQRLADCQRRQAAGEKSLVQRIERLANELGRRTGTDPVSGTRITKRGPTRQCSYCKHVHGRSADEGKDHNRRTCPQLKTDLREAITTNAIYRAGVLEGLRSSGVGLGSLIAQTISGYFTDPEEGEQWRRRKVPTLVRTVLWDSVCYLDDDAGVLQIQRMDKMGSSDGFEGLEAPLRHDGDGHLLRFDRKGGWTQTSGQVYGRWHVAQEAPEKHDTTLLSPVPGETINPPEGWEYGESQVILDHFSRLKG